MPSTFRQAAHTRHNTKVWSISNSGTAHKLTQVNAGVSYHCAFLWHLEPVYSPEICILADLSGLTEVQAYTCKMVAKAMAPVS